MTVSSETRQSLPEARTCKMRIVAQDPSVRIGGKILTAEVDVPAEELADGPRGYRVHVIDYDSSSKVLYPPVLCQISIA